MVTGLMIWSVTPGIFYINLLISYYFLPDGYIGGNGYYILIFLLSSKSIFLTLKIYIKNLKMI